MLAILQSCHGNVDVVAHVMVVVAWQYISDGFENAIVGRYGGCFEEGI